MTAAGQRCARALALSALLVLVVFAPAASAVPTRLGEWRFDESGGQRALDAGPLGLDGRLGDSDAADVADPDRIGGLSGRALRFDGRAVVRLPDADELAVQALTVEAVVRAPASPGRWRYIMSRGSFRCFAGSYGLYTGAGGGIAFYVFDGQQYVVSAAARPEDVWDGAWHHIGATFDGSALRLLVDGRPVGVPATGLQRIDYASTTSSAAFGRYVGDCNLAFDGDLDMVRLWSGARTPEALAAAAAQQLHPGLPAPTGPLPATPPAAYDAAPPARRGRDDAGAPPRACALRLSRTRISPRRRTVVRVRVTVRGRPARAVAVRARRHGRTKPITAARTGARGRARLVLKVRRTGRLRITAATRPRCVPRFVRVARKR
jgi:Concanavalin A-like lectin/glucanases superfamily